MMGTFSDRRFMLVCAALATVILIVGAGAAGDYGQNQQQYGDRSSQQQGFQSSSQMGSQGQDQYGSQTSQQQGYSSGSRTGPRAGMQGNRNQQLERQVASQLRDQGLGQQGQILVLAIGNRVILLGQVPDQNQKQQADQITRQASGVGQVDNRLVVLSEATRKSGTQLTQDIQRQLSRLPGDAGQNIQVQSRNGRIILRGQVDNWLAMADAIQAAFTAGAPYVVSQITTTGQGQYAGRFGYQRGYGAEAGEQYGQYGYQPPEEREYGQGYEQDRYQGQQYGRGMGARDRWRQTGEDRRQEQQAEQIAKSVSGLQTVQNDLTVGASGTAFPPLGYIPEQAGAAGQQDTGSAGDIRCTQMLKQNLTSQNLKDAAGNIFVTCHNGQMALYGNVKTDDEKDQIGRVAKQVQGIKNVDNSLTVRKETAEQKSDAQLKEDVESQLWWSPFVDSSKIDVTAQNGVVTLSGTVKDWDAQKAAIKNAFDAGAKRVRSKLQIEGQPTTAMSQTGTSQGYGATQQ